MNIFHLYPVLPRKKEELEASTKCLYPPLRAISAIFRSLCGPRNLELRKFRQKFSAVQKPRDDFRVR